MARIRINKPESFFFKMKLVVRVDDINYGGHLSNDRLLTLCHEARIQFFEHFGYNETDIEGIGIIMTDAAIIYKAEAFRGDVLSIEMTVDDWNKYGFDLLYFISDECKNHEVARVKTGIVFFDYENRKIKQVVPAFYNLFNEK